MLVRVYYSHIKPNRAENVRIDNKIGSTEKMEAVAHPSTIHPLHHNFPTAAPRPMDSYF